MSERAQALEQANYFLDAIDEIATIGAAPKHHTGQSAMPPPYNMTPSTAKNIKWNTREIRSKLALLASAAPPVGVSPQPEGTWPADYIGRSFVDGASWWQFHHNGSTMFVSEREEAEAEAERRYGPPLSPVEPTPEPPQGVNRQWLSRIAARLAAHDRGDRSPSDDLFAWESLAYLLKYLSVEPTPDAQVCAWREELDEQLNSRWFPACCGGKSTWYPPTTFCGFCSKRLVVGTAPQGGEQ